MMRFKTVSLLVALLLMTGVLVAAVGVGIGRALERAIIQRYELEAIANRLQVKADWDAVRRNVYCDILELGSPRTAIEAKLQAVGHYQARRDALHPYYTISFDNYFARLTLGDLYLAYDENDRLAEKLHWVGLGEAVPVNCS